jgi:hypothetical protein
MVVTPSGKVLVFWRAKCLLTGREENRQSAMNRLLPFEQMREWVNTYFRNLELLEVRPWDPAEDGHRTLYPVPPQHVRFHVPVPDLAKPDPRRISVLISNRRLTPRRLLHT